MEVPPLEDRSCIPCQPGTPALDDDRIAALQPEVAQWSIRDGKLVRELGLKNFRQALALVNKVADLAEQEGHHPDISLFSWNRVRIELVTHSIGGLSENDFILAAKIDTIVDGDRRLEASPTSGNGVTDGT